MSLIHNADQYLSHIPRLRESISGRETPIRRIFYFHSEDLHILKRVVDHSTYLWEILCRLPRADRKMERIEAGDRYQKGLEEQWLMDYRKYRVLARMGKAECVPRALLLTDFHLYAEERGVEKSQPGLLKWFLEESALENTILLVSSVYVHIPVGYHDEVELIQVGVMDMEDVKAVINRGLETARAPEDEELLLVSRPFLGLSERQILSILEKCRATGYCSELDAVTPKEKADCRKRTARFIAEEKKKLVKKDPAFVFVDYEEEELPVGTDRYMQWLKLRRVLFADPDKAGTIGGGQARGVLVSGVPGTGKTMLAKLTAWELGGLPLVKFQMNKIQSHYYGDSGANLSSYLARIESIAPCVMLVDEVERFLRDSDSTHEATDMLLGQFLMWMQDHKQQVFVFFTSNDVSNVPPALLRPGRLSGRFFSFMPTEQALAAMVDSKLNSMASDEAERFFDGELRQAIRANRFGKTVLERIGALIGETGEPYFLSGVDVDELLSTVHLLLLDGGKLPATAGDYLQTVEECLRSGEVQPYGWTDMDYILNIWMKAKEKRYRSTAGDDLFSFGTFRSGMKSLPQRSFVSSYDRALYHQIGEKLVERLNRSR